MKRIIKKSTTITEMIVDDNGQTFIINRKYSVKNNSESIFNIGIEPEIENRKELDKYFRLEMAKEAEEYKKKNPLPKTEEDLPDTSNQKKD